MEALPTFRGVRGEAMTCDMRTFSSLLLLLASCVAGCTGDAMKPIKVQSVTQIEFRPVSGTANVITNAAELTLIGEWLNDALKSPISSFTLKSYPKPVHSVALKFKSGDSQTFLISSGSVLQPPNQPTKPGLVERLTVLSIQGQQYLVKSCPEALLYPRPTKPPP